MRVGLRTTLAMIAVSSIPLAVAGWSAIRLSDSALQGRAKALYSSNARLLSERIGDDVRHRVNAVQLAASANDLNALSDAEKLGLQRLVFRQVDGASVVALLTVDGTQVTRPVYLDRQSQLPGLTDRPVVTDADVELFAKHIPLEDAVQFKLAIGPPYVSSAGAPRVAVAVHASEQYVLTVEISLGKLNEMVVGHEVGRRGRAFVVDQAGLVLLSADADAVASRADRSRWPVVAAALAGDPAPTSFDDPTHGRAFGHGVRVANLGWAVVLMEPASDALAESRTLTRNTVLWFLVALVAAVLLGIASSRTVVRPLQALHSSASALQDGKLEHRAEGTGRSDELGDLARAFNQMADEVQRWSRELEDRVEQRTKELRESHELLGRAQKLAAVGQLGAGVAHEINNPLAAILGNVELLLEEEFAEEDIECLEVIQQQGQRIQGIVAQLKQLADSEESVKLVAIDIVFVVRRALAQIDNVLHGSEVAVKVEFDEDLPKVSGKADLLIEALAHMMENACQAMAEGGSLTVRIECPTPQLVAVRISDTGVGIAKELHGRIFEPFYTSRLQEGAKGLGLPRVEQIMQLVDGKVTLESEVGAGTTFTVLLPATQARSFV